MPASGPTVKGQNQISPVQQGRVIKSKFDFNFEDECATCALRDYCPWDNYVDCLEARVSYWFYWDAALGRVVD